MRFWLIIAHLISALSWSVLFGWTQTASGEEKDSADPVSTVAIDCCRWRGDINHDGDRMDLWDILYLVEYMFCEGNPPPCLQEADVNADGFPGDIEDLVRLVTCVVREGRLPPPCSEWGGARW